MANALNIIAKPIDKVVLLSLTAVIIGEALIVLSVFFAKYLFAKYRDKYVTVIEIAIPSFFKKKIANKPNKPKELPNTDAVANRLI